MKKGEDINLDPATFDPRVLPQGRIDTGGDTSLIRIPTLPGRIRIRKDGYVELILESHYDREAGQSRNKKVVIGTDDSGFLPGMMTPNDNYHNLFNGRGQLYDDPMKHSPEEDAKGTPSPNEQPDQNPKAQATQAARNTSGPQNPQTASNHQIQPKATSQSRPEGTPTDTNINQKLQQLAKALEEKRIRLRDKEYELNQRERELNAWHEQLEKKEEELFFHAEDTDKDHIKLLSYILDSYKETISQQARKKPDAPMTRKQIRTINEVLGELKPFFAGCETDSLLHLAEEPDPTTDNPGTTNGEMALLISAYQYTINAYRYDELRKK